MFSYKAQVDDVMEDDNVSLPHQQSFSSLKTDSDYIYQVINNFHIHQIQKSSTYIFLCFSRIIVYMTAHNLIIQPR